MDIWIHVVVSLDDFQVQVSYTCVDTISLKSKVIPDLTKPRWSVIENIDGSLGE